MPRGTSEQSRIEAGPWYHPPYARAATADCGLASIGGAAVSRHHRGIPAEAGFLDGGSWRDVWPAGLLAAILVSSGQMLIGLYVSFGGVKSAFGAAASVIVLLFGLYYAAFVVLLGGQFSKVYADRRGRSSTLDSISPA